MKMDEENSVYSQDFKNELFNAIARKYKPREHEWNPQPGIGMVYKTIKGIKTNELKKDLENEDFEIESMVITLKNWVYNNDSRKPVKFILKRPFSGDSND